MMPKGQFLRFLRNFSPNNAKVLLLSRDKGLLSSCFRHKAKSIFGISNYETSKSRSTPETTISESQRRSSSKFNLPLGKENSCKFDCIPRKYLIRNFYEGHHPIRMSINTFSLNFKVGIFSSTTALHYA